VKLIREGETEGLLRDDIDIHLVEFALFGMINWTHRWYKPGGSSSPKEVADAFIAIFFDGVAVQHPR
jgi:TetR/AcrR family transcriptional regulator, cholesterol catabolism regulator